MYVYSKAIAKTVEWPTPNQGINAQIEVIILVIDVCMCHGEIPLRLTNRKLLVKL